MGYAAFLKRRCLEDDVVGVLAIARSAMHEGRQTLRAAVVAKAPLPANSSRDAEDQSQVDQAVSYRLRKLTS